MQPTEIVRRVDIHKAARSNVEMLWNDVEKYSMPLRLGDMFQRIVAENAVDYFRDDVYDSTAIWALQKMANSMHGSITNPQTKWYGRQYQQPKLNKDNDATLWVQESTAREWTELYNSNFDAEVSGCYQDLCGPGNCFMSVEAENDSPTDWAGFNFAATPIKESFFERDHRGDMFRYFRWMNWRASEFATKWPKLALDGKLPMVVQKELAEGGNPDTRFDLIYAVYVRLEKLENMGSLKVLGVTERPVGCKYVLKNTKEQVGDEGGFYEFPILHAPFETTSGSQWGHGPAMLLSPTIKYINFWLELEDLAVRKMIDPAILATERGLISQLNLQPGGITVVRDLEKSLKVFHAEGRIDLSKMSLEDMRKSVREGFHNDELQLRDSPQMSATEAQIRYELMNRVLGPTMGRIQNSLLSPVLDRTFKTLLRNKQFAEPPDIVKKSNAQFKVVYTGALMRAQQSDEVAAIERWLGQIGGIAKVMPQVLNVVDIVEVARQMALKLGIPVECIRSVAEVKELVQHQQQVAAQQAKAAMQQQQGNADEAQGKGAQALQQSQQPQQQAA